MYNGERYDIIINGDQPVDNYWMRVVGLADCEVKNASQLAIIRYRGANETDPSESRFHDDVNRDGKVYRSPYFGFISCKFRHLETVLVVSRSCSTRGYTYRVYMNDKKSWFFVKCHSS